MSILIYFFRYHELFAGFLIVVVRVKWICADWRLLKMVNFRWIDTRNDAVWFAIVIVFVHKIRNCLIEWDSSTHARTRTGNDLPRAMCTACTEHIVVWTHCLLGNWMHAFGVCVFINRWNCCYMELFVLNMINAFFVVRSVKTNFFFVLYSGWCS